MKKKSYFQIFLTILTCEKEKIVGVFFKFNSKIK